MKYKKTLTDLEKVAIKWWPKELEAEVAKSSVIPKLLQTLRCINGVRLSWHSVKP